MLAKIITQPQDCLGLRVSQKIHTLGGLTTMAQEKFSISPVVHGWEARPSTV